jgi:flagellar protein FliO/FliZ
VDPRAEPRPEPMAAATEPSFASAADQNIAEMAHRLEAALRRPPRSKESRIEELASPIGAATAQVPPAPQPNSPPSEPKPLAGEQKPALPKSLYDSLEQEMATLLGRPPDKT